MMTLSHLDEHGNARMVAVGSKPITERMALAKGEVHMSAATLALVVAGNLAKGDVFTTAQIAGVFAAKRTAELIPLCHSLPLQHVQVDFRATTAADDWVGIEITASAQTYARTGVEMDALTAVSVAALTVYDMVKAAQPTLRLMNIRLVEKHGGKHGVLRLE
jgi:cyclic pyranopterin phosphate synthase